MCLWELGCREHAAGCGISHRMRTNVSLGLYISVPFCRTKCSYCNFASDVFSKSAYENYVVRLLEDIAEMFSSSLEI